MSSEQEPHNPSENEPHEQHTKGSAAFQELASYLDELGLFSLGDVDQPLSIEDAKAFRDSLSPEQLQKLAALEAAYNAS